MTLTKIISKVIDISVKVQPLVFHVWFEDGDMIVAKPSYFGKYELSKRSSHHSFSLQ